MRLLVAWRILSHEVARSLLAVLGVFAAVVLVFLQLGFYGSVPIGSTMVLEGLDFDIAISSPDYVFQIRPHWFPRRRVLQALADPDVEAASPYYQGNASYLNEAGVQRNVFVMGVDPDRRAFRTPGVLAFAERLKATDVAIIDTASRAEFAIRAPDGAVEVNDRRIRIVGEYDLGTGFVGLGVIVVSEPNFLRLFPGWAPEYVHAGLVRLRPGADAEAVAARLNATLPGDARARTRAAMLADEQGYWLGTTSTGLVFGFGVAVAAIVGTAILFQTLSAFVLRHIAEYAMLKAIGYTDRYLGGIVIAQGVLIAAIALIPAVAASFSLYDFTRTATVLPVYMTELRIVVVSVATLAVAVVAALTTMRMLQKADPVDLF